MAFTVSTVVQGVVFGNQLIKVLNVTADGNEDNVSTGLKNISFSIVGSVSAPTAPSARDNSNSSGAVAAGTLGISNCTSGNIYRVVVFGS